MKYIIPAVSMKAFDQNPKVFFEEKCKAFDLFSFRQPFANYIIDIQTLITKHLYWLSWICLHWIFFSRVFCWLYLKNCV